MVKTVEFKITAELFYIYVHNCVILIKTVMIFLKCYEPFFNEQNINLNGGWNFATPSPLNVTKSN